MAIITIIYFMNLHHHLTPQTLNTQHTSLNDFFKNSIKQIQSQKKAARRAKQLVGKNIGHWTLPQKREYYVFLKIYAQFFVSKDNRRDDKVYRIMANFIKTRSPDQCRTHHKKLELKFKKISRIINSLEVEFGPIKHQQIVLKCSVSAQQNLTDDGSKQFEANTIEISQNCVERTKQFRQCEMFVQKIQSQNLNCQFHEMDFFSQEPQMLILM